MTTYEHLSAYETTLNPERALNEIKALKAKYSWLKCDHAIATLEKLTEDWPMLMKIIRLQDKRAIIATRAFEVNTLSDEVIRETLSVKKIDPDKIQITWE